MQLEYTQTTEDYAAFNTYVMRTSESLTKQAALQRAIGTVLVFVLALLVIGVAFRDWAGGVVTGAGTAVVVWFILPPVNRWQFDRTLRRLSAGDGLGPTGTARVSLDDAGLLHEVAGMSTTIPWARVERVEETADHVFVFIGPHAAVTVPRRAAGASALADEVRRRLGEARDGARSL